MATAAALLPSAAVISAVLEHADVIEDLGGGRLLHRLSPRRSRSRAVRGSLGREADRAARVSVLYDEREAQIVRVDELPSDPMRAPVWAGRTRFNENDDRWWAARGLAA